MNIRTAILAMVLMPMVAVAQAVAPLPDPAKDAAAAPEYKETQAPAVDLNITTKPAEAPAPVPAPDTASMEKIRQVAAEMDKAAATKTPAAAAQPTPVQAATDATPWNPTKNALKAIVGLCITLALLFLLSHLVKRYGKHSPLFAGADLARVLGKVYLTPKASLHFVRTNDKILVVGVTQTNISRVAEFEADAFQTLPEETGTSNANEPGATPAGSETETFLNQFKASLENISRAVPTDGAAEENDSEISALREDVQRLQQYLQESVREDSH